MKNSGLIVGMIVVVIVAGGGFYAWQSGLLNLIYQIPQVQTAQESAPQEAAATETATVPAPSEPEQTGTPVEGSSYTVEEFEAKPTLCEKDSDCKVQLITCNKCDCGRGVNNYIPEYQCTQADKANPCNVVCPPSKAVCDNGACKKVAA